MRRVGWTHSVVHWARQTACAAAILTLSLPVSAAENKAKTHLDDTAESSSSVAIELDDDAESADHYRLLSEEPVAEPTGGGTFTMKVREYNPKTPARKPSIKRITIRSGAVPPPAVQAVGGKSVKGIETPVPLPSPVAAGKRLVDEPLRTVGPHKVVNPRGLQTLATSATPDIGQPFVPAPELRPDAEELEERTAQLTQRMMGLVGIQREPSLPTATIRLPQLQSIEQPVVVITEREPARPTPETIVQQLSRAETPPAAQLLTPPARDAAPLPSAYGVQNANLIVERPLVPLGGPRVVAGGRRDSNVAQVDFQEELGDDSPFEVIDETGNIDVMVRRGKVLRTQLDIYRSAVVDPAVCDVLQFTPREIQIIGKSEGATHVTFWFEGGLRRPVTYLVRVRPDTEEVRRTEVKYRMLEDVLGELFPDSKIHLTILANKLIVRGQARDSEEAARIMQIINAEQNRGRFGSGSSTATEVFDQYATGRQNNSKLQIVNLLTVPGVQQVALRVKIAELNRSAGRGLDLSLASEIKFKSGDNGHTLFLNSLMAVASGDMPALLTQVDGEDLKLGLNMLEQHGVIRLLSEPTLVTLSGRPATFVAGGEFAVPTTVGSAGLNAVTTDFRAFGAIISFLPTVLDKDRIRLQVAPEFSQVNGSLSVNGTPGLDVRSVATTVEMREGQTLAIAGLIDDNMTASKSWNLPLIGRWPFNNRSVSRNETELIILITPELIYPMEMEETSPLPGFDVTEPNNRQFYINGHIEGDPALEYDSTKWPRLKERYGRGGPSVMSGPYGHGQ